MPRKKRGSAAGGAKDAAAGARREAAMRGWSAKERQAIYDAVVEFGEHEWNLVRWCGLVCRVSRRLGQGLPRACSCRDTPAGTNVAWSPCGA